MWSNLKCIDCYTIAKQLLIYNFCKLQQTFIIYFGFHFIGCNLLHIAMDCNWLIYNLTYTAVFETNPIEYSGLKVPIEPSQNAYDCQQVQ